MAIAAFANYLNFLVNWARVPRKIAKRTFLCGYQSGEEPSGSVINYR